MDCFGSDRGDAHLKHIGISTKWGETRCSINTYLLHSNKINKIISVCRELLGAKFLIIHIHLCWNMFANYLLDYVCRLAERRNRTKKNIDAPLWTCSLFDSEISVELTETRLFSLHHLLPNPQLMNRKIKKYLQNYFIYPRTRKHETK